MQATWRHHWLASHFFLEEGCDRVQKDLGWAAELYTRAIDDGNSTHAMWRLAKVLCRGGDGVVKDMGRALQLFNGAVDGGNVETMFEFGIVLYCFVHNPLIRLATPRRSIFLPLHSVLCLIDRCLYFQSRYVTKDGFWGRKA